MPTARPLKPETETIARLTMTGNVITVHFPEKLEPFRKLLRYELGFTWSGAAWERTIDRYAGDPDDRLAEAGRAILAAGYIVHFPDDASLQAAVAGSFKPEQRRWVTVRDGRFRFWWRRGEDPYRQIMRLASARYEPPGIVVRAEHYAEVLDAASIHGFALDDKAKVLVEKAKAARADALVVELQPISRPKPEPASVSDTTGEIDGELLDDPL